MLQNIWWEKKKTRFSKYRSKKCVVTRRHRVTVSQRILNHCSFVTDTYSCVQQNLGLSQ